MALSHRDYDEKRDFLRMDVSCKLAYKSPSDNIVFQGVTKNLSGTGALIETEQSLPLNQLLELHVKPGHDATPPLEALARVMRVIEGPNGKFVIGLQFEEVRNAYQDAEADAVYS